jgi:hypothetical protein
MSKHGAVVLSLVAILILPGATWAQSPPLPFLEFFAYPPDFTGGVATATCGPDYLDRMWFITGAGPGGGPHVVAHSLDLDSNFVENYSFFPYDPAFTGGVDVSCSIDVLSGVVLLVTSPKGGGGPHVRTFFLP